MARQWVALIFSMLCTAFVVYSAVLYSLPNKMDRHVDDALVVLGREVYQKNNCQSCHQIFGLGGFLGPDLTNVMSTDGKGEAYLSLVVMNGVRQMPAFHLDHDEMKGLAAFLTEVDHSGISDPRSFYIHPDGMIEQK